MSNTIKDVQSINWKGAIPITLSLAPSSLSSPTMPSPVFRMVSRQTFLHIALEDEVRRFHEYAPMITNFKSVQQSASDEQGEDGEINRNYDNGNPSQVGNKDRDDDEKDNNLYPKCWFEDEDTGTALRWHLFTGLLYDLLKLRKMTEESIHYSHNGKFLPWRIRVHFTSYPETILPLDEDIPQVIFQNYLNSLKQALYVQHNSNRIAKNMNKKSHLQVWDGIKRGRFEVYHEVTSGLNGSRNGNSGNIVSGDDITLEHIPVRVLVNGQPPFARPCQQYEKGDTNKATMIGDVLHEWLPELFPKDATSCSDLSNCNWCIQGMKVSLNTSLSDLWKGLCHPDRFLYVIIVTN